MAVPKIRFPGFTEDWEQRKLSGMATFSKGSGYSKADLKTSGKPIILYGRMYTKYETIIRNVDTFAEEKAGSVYSESGDVIVPASGETAQDISRASVVANSGILLGGDINIIHPNNELNPGFLALTISNGNQQKKLSMKAQGATIVHLHNEDLKGVDILCPSIDEQTLISEFFERIDNTITLHQRKLESIKLLKKSLLQKMFPKSGESVPEVRFPGFTDAWEQRKVSELLEERNEQAPESSDYPLMAFIANIGVAPKGERYDRGALVKDAENKLYKRTEIGDFIYSSNNLETGSIGLNNYGNACISPVYSIFKPTGIADSDFIGRRFIRKDFINSMVKWRQGVVYGQWKIHESDFMKIQVAVPSLEEQRKIGEFLSSLDNLITLHQRKVEALQKLKKSLLQQMFV